MRTRLKNDFVDDETEELYEPMSLQPRPGLRPKILGEQSRTDCDREDREVGELHYTPERALEFNPSSDET